MPTRASAASRSPGCASGGFEELERSLLDAGRTCAFRSANSRLLHQTGVSSQIPTGTMSAPEGAPSNLPQRGPVRGTERGLRPQSRPGRDPERILDALCTEAMSRGGRQQPRHRRGHPGLVSSCSARAPSTGRSQGRRSPRSANPPMCSPRAVPHMPRERPLVTIHRALRGDPSGDRVPIRTAGLRLSTYVPRGT